MQFTSVSKYAITAFIWGIIFIIRVFTTSATSFVLPSPHTRFNLAGLLEKQTPWFVLSHIHYRYVNDNVLDHDVQPTLYLHDQRQCFFRGRNWWDPWHGSGGTRRMETLALIPCLAIYLHDEYWWGERVKMWAGVEGVSVLSIQEAWHRSSADHFLFPCGTPRV